MKLIDILQAANGRVCGGSEYQWKCYPNAQFMDISDLDGEHIASCVFSRNNHDVYEADVHVYEDKISYRWVAPEWKQALRDEANARGIKNKFAYDDVPYIKIKHEKEFLSLLTHIVHKTYVHSKHNPKLAAEAEFIAEEARFAKPLTPNMAWPFPTGDEFNVEEEGHGNGEDHAEDSREGWINPNPYTGKENEMKTRYEVTLTEKHLFEIDATSMEEAIEKAREFNGQMRPPAEWGDGLAWIDRYVVKQTAGETVDE